METVFRKTLFKRLKKIRKVIKRKPTGNYQKIEIFDNLPMLFSVLAEREEVPGDSSDIFSFKSKNQKKYAKEIRSKLQKIKNYLHFSRDSQT